MRNTWTVLLCLCVSWSSIAADEKSATLGWPSHGGAPGGGHCSGASAGDYLIAYALPD